MLKISDFLCRNAVSINIKACKKKDAIIELIEMLVEEGKIKNLAKAIQSVMDREKIDIIIDLIESR